MPPRARKLRVNESDETGQPVIEDGLGRGWVSGGPWDPRNAYPEVEANMQDHGFEHLNIPASAPVFTDPVSLPASNFTIQQQNTNYLDVFHTKLTLAKCYILKEQELGLDPDRPGIHREQASILLAVSHQGGYLFLAAGALAYGRRGGPQEALLSFP
ncbi:hypothetical protein EJ02DRAFT_356702 [Clathrospora elynae]|uniref:Uncharacterized protein n=1 Tax=Clathrospora elynae TaxID=706981 RepID=A0A6A5SD80_9PLEO|nr:hypothetical protein EJ02DRAFT_356702 [Clathrospora elynae]